MPCRDEAGVPALTLSKRRPFEAQGKQDRRTPKNWRLKLSLDGAQRCCAPTWRGSEFAEGVGYWAGGCADGGEEATNETHG
jgi:hypothetical protein